MIIIIIIRRKHRALLLEWMLIRGLWPVRSGLVDSLDLSSVGVV